MAGCSRNLVRRGELMRAKDLVDEVAHQICLLADLFAAGDEPPVGVSFPGCSSFVLEFLGFLECLLPSLVTLRAVARRVASGQGLQMENHLVAAQYLLVIELVEAGKLRDSAWGVGSAVENPAVQDQQLLVVFPGLLGPESPQAMLQVEDGALEVEPPVLAELHLAAGKWVATLQQHGCCFGDHLHSRPTGLEEFQHRAFAAAWAAG